MIPEAFKPEHLAELLADPAPSTATALGRADEAYGRELLEGGPSATLRTDSGQIIACAGIMEMPQGSLLWSFMARAAGEHKVGLFRAARRLVEIARRPTFALAAMGFAKDCRFLECLGLHYTRDLKDFGPARESYHIFAIGEG